TVWCFAEASFPLIRPFGAPSPTRGEGKEEGCFGSITLLPSWEKVGFREAKGRMRGPRCQPHAPAPTAYPRTSRFNPTGYNRSLPITITCNLLRLNSPANASDKILRLPVDAP